MKQKMRMAHLSPEVRAEKLARNEELVGGQKKLDIDKDGKIEKSDLETIRTKKLKEDVTTAAQKLKAALDRHTEHAVAANRAGDHDAVKVHQGYANKIKTQLGKLAKNEEMETEQTHVEKIKVPLGSRPKGIGWGMHKSGSITGSDHDIYKRTTKSVPKSSHSIREEDEIDEAGPMMDLPNPDRTDRLGVSYNPHRKVKTASDLARIAKGKTSVSKEKPGQLRKPNPPSTRKATVSSLMKMLDQMGEEVEIDEASRAKLTNYISAAKSDEKKDRSVGIALAQKKKWGDEKHGTVSAKVPANEGHQVVATTKEGETFKSGIHSTKEKALGQHYKMAKSGNFKKIATLKTEEVEEIEERNKQNAMMRKTMDASRGARYKLNNPVPDAEPEHKTAQAHNKAIGRALRSEDKMTDAEMANREKIVKGMKKSFKDFTAKYGDRAKEVMYATATKKAMEEEIEEELEEDMDEGVTTRNGAVTVHKGTYGTSYQGDDEDDENDTPEKKEPAVKRGRGRPAGAKSGAKPKGSSAGKSYGGVALHSLRLPNNNK
jgi:hypothetical protein